MHLHNVWNLPEFRYRPALLKCLLKTAFVVLFRLGVGADGNRIAESVSHPDREVFLYSYAALQREIKAHVSDAKAATTQTFSYDILVF